MSLAVEARHTVMIGSETRRCAYGVARVSLRLDMSQYVKGVPWV